MRAFFAINPPTKIQEEISIINEELKKYIPDIKWVRKDNLHLTLKFLGDIRGNNLDTIIDFSQVYFSQQDSFVVQLKNINIFPAYHPRIIFIKLNSAELTKFAEKFIQQIKKFNFLPNEQRQFLPHITLGRINRQISKYHITQLQKINYQNKFIVSSVDLMQSKLRPSGPIYSLISKFKLQ